jgi:molybdopterin molybdotransferase
MDKCKHDISLPGEEAIENILKQCAFHPAAESVPVREACGRVLAGDVFSRNTLPNILTSNWDGIAVRFSDFENGMPDTSHWKEGKEYVFCNTGIGITGDFDTSVRIEKVDLDASGKIIIRDNPVKGQATTPRGAKMKEGDLLVKGGTMLTPLLLSHITTGGNTSVSVLKKPAVSFLPTGSELVPAGETLPQGKNVESNSVMVYAKLLQWGAEPIIYPVIPDQLELLLAAVRDALSKSDIVVINAGSSMGKDDFTVEVLETVGTILNHQVDYGPGKHTSFTMAGNGVPIVGISGPPMGAEFTSDFYIKPLIDRYLGQDVKPPKIRARLSADYNTGRPVSVITRVSVERDQEDRYIVTPHLLTMGTSIASIDKCNGFALMPPSMHKGDIVEVELRYPYRFF